MLAADAWMYGRGDREPGSYEAACSSEVIRKVRFGLASGQERYIKT